MKRYFDPSIPSAEVKPTQISKVSLPVMIDPDPRQVNTALQLSLMGLTLINPLLPVPLTTSLTALQ
jgi:cardiolipin synthase